MVVLFHPLNIGWQTLSEPSLAPDHDGLGAIILGQSDQGVGGQVAGLGPDIGDVTQIRWHLSAGTEGYQGLIGDDPTLGISD